MRGDTASARNIVALEATLKIDGSYTPILHWRLVGIGRAGCRVGLRPTLNSGRERGLR